MSRSKYLVLVGLGLWITLALDPARCRAAGPVGDREGAPTVVRAAPAAAPVTQPVSRAARHAREAELRAIEARAREAVADLVRRMGELPEGPARRVLEARAIEVKREAESQRLATIASYSQAASGPLGESSVTNWTNNGVPVCTYGILPTEVDIAPDGAGGCIVVWRDGRNAEYQIYAQRLNASGSPLWTLDGVRVAPTSTDQNGPRVIGEPDGGALIVWEDPRVSSNYDIYAQRLTASGTVAPGWAASGVALSTDVKHESEPVVVADGSGGAIVVFQHWYGYSPLDIDIHANRVTGAGAIAPGWPADGIAVTAATYVQRRPVIARDGAGGAFVAWEDSWPSLGAETDVSGSHIMPSGTIAPGWGLVGQLLCEAPGEQYGPRIVEASGGSAIVVWSDRRSGFPNEDIFAQRVAGDGTLLWGLSGAEACSAPGLQSNPELCSDGYGGAIAAWDDNRSGGSDLFAQRLGLSGESLWTGGGQQLCTTIDYWGGTKSLSANGQGGAVVVWEDHRAGVLDPSIYAQHIAASGQRAWPATGLPVCTMDGSQLHARAATDGAGGAIFCWEDERSVNPGIYARQVTGLSNLNCTVTGFGWSSPAVPRDALTPDQYNVVVTPTLEGNTENTYLNWLMGQEGPNPMPFWKGQCWLDDTFGWEFTAGDSNPPGWLAGINAGPNIVRGGRHTLTSLVDVDQVVPESNEADNVWRGQWVWSPLPLTANVPVLRDAPPERGGLADPNSDGMQFTRFNPALAWLVSLAPRATGDDYDLFVYDDYAGSTSGFSQLRAYSRLASNATDYVVGHWSGTPMTVYPAAVLFDPAGGGHRFFMDATEANGNANTPPATWLHVPLNPGRAADVWEMLLDAGTSYGWTVVREQGQSELELRIFPPTAGGIYGRFESAGVSTPVGPDVAQLAYTATATGYHPVVVSRTTGDYAVYESAYSLRWNEGAPVDVPGQIAEIFELSFRGAAPNPARERAALWYSVSERTPVRLEIFDLEGRRLRTLVDEPMDAGPHVAAWDCTDAGGVRVGPGIYWARLTAQGRTLAKRMTIVR